MRVQALFVLLLATAATVRPADEAALLSEVRPPELERHSKEIVRHVRPSGSPGENAAIDYIVEVLKDDGIPVEVYEFSAFVSDPVRASFRVETPDPREYPALTQAFSASTGRTGVEGELVDLGRGAPADYEGRDVEGKLVLVDGLADPEGVQAAQNAGAAGAVFTATADRVNEMTVGPVWGTPGPEDAALLPRIPSVAISREAGAEIRKRLSSGPVRAQVTTEVSSGFETLRLPVATIRSPRDPEGFVLVGGHIDAWHHGGTDEGASNAAMVEMARIFHRHRDELERGLKVAWWPGHSNGRYAGSTWYVDRFWNELRRHAVAYLNIDGVGQKEASLLSATVTSELEPLARTVVKEQAGVEPEVGRPGRNSDQSFYGIGLPLLQFNHERSQAIGGYWWWHTPDDTFDKIDFQILAVDAKLYVGALYRLLARPLPPLSLSGPAAELSTLLADRAAAAGSHVDLGPAMERARRLELLSKQIDERLARGSGALSASEWTRRILDVLRPVTRVLYQERGPYLQDLALGHGQLPGLRWIDSLHSLSSKPLDLGFVEARLRREANRIVDHLDDALERAESLDENLR